MGNKNNDKLTDFQKRAYELLVHKFLVDYRHVRQITEGEELEHFYEVWAKHHIRELAVREQVWCGVMWTVSGNRDA